MKNPIKPNTKIRILSEGHYEYIITLAKKIGYFPPFQKSKSFLFFEEEQILHSTFLKTFENSQNEEIFIELPATIEQKIDANCVAMGYQPVHDINARVLAEKTGSKHSHYFKDVSDLDEVDVYRVCDLFEVNDASGATQHAIKKLLCSGKRGAKGYKKDLEEARDAINRKIAMMKEDRE